MALSTAEAEYMSGSEAATQILWLQRLVNSIGLELEDTGLGIKQPILYVDNQSAIALANNPVHHARSKHIDTREHFLREKVLDNLIDLRYIPTDQMTADGLTKHISKGKLEIIRERLNLWLESEIGKWGSVRINKSLPEFPNPEGSRRLSPGAGANAPHGGAPTFQIDNVGAQGPLAAQMGQ